MSPTHTLMPDLTRIMRPQKKIAAVLLGIAGASMSVGISAASAASATTVEVLDPCAIEWDCVSLCGGPSPYSEGGETGSDNLYSNGERLDSPGEQWPLVLTFDDLIGASDPGGWIHQYIWSYLEESTSS